MTAMPRLAPLALLFFVALLSACGKKELLPVPIDTKNDACAFCRMAVSDPHFASEIVQPGEEARFFDDLGCLRDYLKAHPLAPDAVVFVADHRTGGFVRAAAATYTRVLQVATPMGSHLVAHADPASRAQDASVPPGASVDVSEILGPAR